MFGAAQALGLRRRIERRHRPVRPAQPAKTAFIIGTVMVRRDREQAAFALDHHLPSFVQRRRDQRDPRPRMDFGIAADPFGARTRLAEPAPRERSEEHTSELQSLMRISYAVFCLK